MSIKRNQVSVKEVKDMKIAIETEPKEIADLIVALQGQQDSKSSFVPCDSSGYPFEHSQSQEDSLSKN